LILFWRAKLYADAALQIIYIVISVFGWWNWVRGGAGHTELPISRTTLRTGLTMAVATAAGTEILAGVLHRFTDSVVPFWDGVTTALSLTAQYILSRKLLENWWVWMTADVIYMALYCYKPLYLTGVLYLVLFGMCIAGYTGWRKSHASRAGGPQEVPQEAPAL
jgi:nicotinamide mononucleotide transporter